MYQIQASFKNNPFRLYAMADVHFVPNWEQKMMIDAVEKALLDSVFYTSDMYQRVTAELAPYLTPELLKQGAERVENGDFGMDIYYARKAVEELLARNANTEALLKLVVSGLLIAGKKIKNFNYGSKRFSTITVNELDMSNGIVSFIGTVRGSSKRWGFSMGGNDTRLLSALLTSVEDKTLTEKSDGVITTFTIDPTANRSAEYRCQI